MATCTRTIYADGGAYITRTHLTVGDYLFKVLYLGRKTLSTYSHMLSWVSATDNCGCFKETKGGIYREWTHLKFATDMCEGRCTYQVFHRDVKLGVEARRGEGQKK